METTAASRPRPAHLSSERKYGAAMRHTVASVERIFFTDSSSPGEGRQRARKSDNRGMDWLQPWAPWRGLACPQVQVNPSTEAMAGGSEVSHSRGCERIGRGDFVASWSSQRHTCSIEG